MIKYYPGRVITLSALVMLTTSCSLMPDYKAPIIAKVDQYSHIAEPKKIAEPSEIGDNQLNNEQTILYNNKLSAKWWRLFNSEQLNTLIRQALKANPELSAAKAAIEQAKANYRAQGSLDLPTVDLNAGISRQKFSGASVGIPDAPASTLTLHNASLDVSYNLDLFDKNKNTQLLAKNQLNQQQWQYKATYIMLTANVVNQYIQLAALDDELVQGKKLQEIEQTHLLLLTEDEQLGGSSKTRVLAQKNNLLNAKKIVYNIQKQRDFIHHQLAILMGIIPAQLNINSPMFEQLPLNKATLDNLTLPTNLPLSLPSQLVQQRPDIQLAENLIKTRYAELDIATADQFPQLTLSASYGTLSPDFSDLFTPASIIWNAAAGLTQPLFNGGKLKQQKKGAQAALEQANGLYQQAVLLAFKEVADSLRALNYNAQAHSETIKMMQTSESLLALTEQEKALGVLSYLQSLETKKRYHQAKIQQIQAQAIQLTDTVVLFQTLGGGWWNQEEKL